MLFAWYKIDQRFPLCVCYTVSDPKLGSRKKAQEGSSGFVESGRQLEIEVPLWNSATLVLNTCDHPSMADWRTSWKSAHMHPSLVNVLGARTWALLPDSSIAGYAMWLWLVWCHFHSTITCSDKVLQTYSGRQLHVRTNAITEKLHLRVSISITKRFTLSHAQTPFQGRKEG